MTKCIRYGKIKFHSREQDISRSRAAWLARRAHNPEVVGSNPSSATKEKHLHTQVLIFFVRVMRPTSVACWVSEAKTIRWIVFANGVAQNASFGARLCLENKTTHDGDRREAITRRSLVQILPPQPNKQSTMSAAVFLIRNIKSVFSPGYEADERSLLG